MPTASLQGCGGHERGGVLAPKGQNDKEMKRFFSPAGPIPKVKSSLISVRFCVLAARFTRVLSLFPSLDSRGSRECRTFGSPAASCAKVKSTRVSHHRSAETIRHSLRDGFTTYSALSPAIGLFVTVTSAMRQHCRQLHTSVEASRPRGFVVRDSAFVFCAARSHHIPRTTSVTIAIRPSWWARDARRDASDLPDVTSEMICDRMARRANQRERAN